MEIHLRELEEKDASGMLEWMTDPDISCFFRFNASKITIDACKVFIEKSKNDPYTRHYAIANEMDEYLGTISLKNIDLDKRCAEYAISTRNCIHGTGVAMQATEQILEIAFLNYGLERVYLNVLTENGRANHFYQKAGFIYERCEKHAVKILGEWKDLNWYFINREEV